MSNGREMKFPGIVDNRLISTRQLSLSFTRRVWFDTLFVCMSLLMETCMHYPRLFKTLDTTEELIPRLKRVLFEVFLLVLFVVWLFRLLWVSCLWWRLAIL